MKGRAPTKAEKKHINTVSQVGCIVCIIHMKQHDFFGDGHCEIHHIDGQINPGSHLKTVGLCVLHHRIKDGRKNKRWVSLHGDGKAAFAAAYCDENELLTIQADLNKAFNRISTVHYE